MSLSTRQKRSTICSVMTQAHRSLFEQRRQKVFLRQERQLTNPKYAKYLYEKYKVKFSISQLKFICNGQEFRSSTPLMQLLDRHERTEFNLNWYVLFVVLIVFGIVTYGVICIDVYLQSFH